MGLLNKLKGIIFEEEDDEENTSKTESEIKRPIAEKIEPQRVVEPREEKPINKTYQEPIKREPQMDMFSSNDVFKTENTFPFPDFDEEEFSNMSRVQKSKPKSTTNVLEYEKKKKIEKKYDYGRYERVEKTEIVEKKKFRPSPIISPVYGILNEDYKPEDIKDKTENKDYNNLDFNSVRKKAFGETSKEEPKTTYYEETVTVKLKEDDDEKRKKVKTIDELLESSADVEIPIPSNDDEITIDEPKITEYDKIEEELQELDKNDKKSKEEQVLDDDTLENDLFDLIDSMYDNREDGE